MKFKLAVAQIRFTEIAHIHIDIIRDMQIYVSMYKNRVCM